MNEKWMNCTEFDIPKDKYEVSEVTQNSEGTKILLGGLQNDVLVDFGFVDSLRITDEGRRIRTYDEVIDIQDYIKSFVGNPIFKVENSEFVKWIDLESCGSLIDITHYAIITENDIVDIISSFPPKVIMKEN